MQCKTITWRTPSPLWELARQDETDQRLIQPALLRFERDSFIEDLQRLLARRPSNLANLVARTETKDDEQAGWQTEMDCGPKEPLKLYQPAHERFYLVAASLICEMPGLPDKRVDTAEGETVYFVLRRLGAEEDAVDEYRWQRDPDQPLFRVALTPQHDLCVGEDGSDSLRQIFSGQKRPIPNDAVIFAGALDNRWIVKDRGDKRAFTIEKIRDTLNVYSENEGWQRFSGEEPPQEERLPLFPIVFQDNGRKRRIFVGFVPIAAQPNYQTQPELDFFSASAADQLQPPLFTLRCIYEQSRQGKAAKTTISRPTRPFEMGAFEDPQAPVQPLL